MSCQRYGIHCHRSIDPSIWLFSDSSLAVIFWLFSCLEMQGGVVLSSWLFSQLWHVYPEW